MKLMDYINYDIEQDIPTVKSQAVRVPQPRNEYDELLAGIFQRHYEERARRYAFSQWHTALYQAVRI